jgi:hypothetical protein
MPFGQKRYASGRRTTTGGCLPLNAKRGHLVEALKLAHGIIISKSAKTAVISSRLDSILPWCLDILQ